MPHQVPAGRFELPEPWFLAKYVYQFHHAGEYQSLVQCVLQDKGVEPLIDSVWNCCVYLLRQSCVVSVERFELSEPWSLAKCVCQFRHTDIYKRFALSTRGEIRTPKTLCLRQVCMPSSITRANIKVEPAVALRRLIINGFQRRTSVTRA